MSTTMPPNSAYDWQGGAPGDLNGVSSPAPAATGVKTYMVQAILCTILLFVPTGIAAIYYAGKVNPALRMGDVAGALRASSKAKKFCWISLGVGVVLFVLGFMIGVLGASSPDTYTY